MSTFRDYLNGEDDGKQISGHAVKVPLPKVSQERRYTCGAAALRAVCEFYGVGPETEDEFVAMLGCDENYGTPPERIIECAKSLGLEASPWHKMSLMDLRRVLDLRKPVICCLQAWGEQADYEQLISGHYVVAIGYEADRLYFEDPLLTESRGYLTESEFYSRWHDLDGCNRLYDRFGIVVWKRDAEGKGGAGRQGLSITWADCIR